jgi:type IV pilus assembly protein PilA
VAPPPEAVKSEARRAATVTVGIVGSAIVILGTLGVVGVLVGRKYLAGPKTAEAKNTLGTIARAAAAAYERDGSLCPSASQPVPGDVSLLRGRKYQSRNDDWEVDRPRAAGFACLGFSMDQPQYYQYRYEATATSFLANARGDLDGDGDLSNFTTTGEVRDGRLVVSPSIEETDPEE